jgi:mono/diheme cytochrome c family protein
MYSWIKTLGVGFFLYMFLNPLYAQSNSSGDEPQATSRGSVIFHQNCAVCHRETGSGTPGLAPPIRQNPGHFIQSDEGRLQLIWTLLYGMYGDVTIDNRHYNFKMPIFAQLTNSQLADVLNHVVGSLNGIESFKPFTEAEVEKERAHTWDGADVLKHRSTIAP